jgi:hypothetical protein
MKMPVQFWGAFLLALAFAGAGSDCKAQGKSPTCYVCPSMEKSFVYLRELDSDGNPVNELGGRWVNSGEQAPITSSTGSISISYRTASSDREILMDPQPCADGNVISVP